MAQMPAGAPPKPAGQGSNAAAYTQPPMAGVPDVMNTDNLPHRPVNTDNVWQSHSTQPTPGGFGGSNGGAR